MTCFYLDASAWYKYYCMEKGSTWIHDMFTANQTLACASLGFIEVMATLSRKYRAGDMESNHFTQKTQALEKDWENFTKVHITDEVIELAKETIKRLGLKGSDTIHLASVLLLKSQIDENIDNLIFISSDKELNNAARTYNIDVINPEEQEG